MWKIVVKCILNLIIDILSQDSYLYTLEFDPTVALLNEEYAFSALNDFEKLHQVLKIMQKALFIKCFWKNLEWNFVASVKKCI